MKFSVAMTAAAICVALAGCAAPATERRLVGAGPSCGGAATRATLVRRGGQVALTSGDGSIVLRGAVDPAGHVQASWSPPARAAASRKQLPATRSVTGTIEAAGAHLRYAAPGCETALELSPPDD